MDKLAKPWEKCRIVWFY